MLLAFKALSAFEQLAYRLQHSSGNNLLVLQSQLHAVKTHCPGISWDYMKDKLSWNRVGTS